MTQVSLFFKLIIGKLIINRIEIMQMYFRFINARRRIVQPMIDSNNRAGKSPAVSVFKNRRRKNSGGASPGASPGNF